jgi:hypothetical protein
MVKAAKEKADVGIGSASEVASSVRSIRDVRYTVWALSVRVWVITSGLGVRSM